MSHLTRVRKTGGRSQCPPFIFAVNSEILDDTQYFDRDYLRTVVDEHQSGAREHSAIIWSLMMFESFLRQVHEPHDRVSSEPSAIHVAAAGE